MNDVISQILAQYVIIYVMFFGVELLLSCTLFGFAWGSVSCCARWSTTSSRQRDRDDCKYQMVKLIVRNSYLCQCWNCWQLQWHHHLYFQKILGNKFLLIDLDWDGYLSFYVLEHLLHLLRHLELGRVSYGFCLEQILLVLQGLPHLLLVQIVQLEHIVLELCWQEYDKQFVVLLHHHSVHLQLLGMLLQLIVHYLLLHLVGLGIDLHLQLIQLLLIHNKIKNNLFY